MLSDLLTEFVYGLGLMSIAGIAYGVIHRQTRNAGLKSIIIGFIFGTIAIFAMMDPVTLGEGIILDARAVIVGLASAFGGLPAAIISGVLVGAFRLNLGGAGAIAGAAGIVASAGLGFAWHRFILTKAAVTPIQLLGLGVLLSLHSVTVLLLPMSVVKELFTTAVPALTVSCVVGALVMGMIIDRERRYIRTERFWREAAGTDSLTGLPNRRTFMERLKLSPSYTKSGQYGAIMIIDIDHFKKVNDTFGHDVGDIVLRHVAAALRGACHNRDLISRLGGEEFAVFCESTTHDDIQRRAETYRAAVEGQVIQHGSKTIPLTVSIGVAYWYDMGSVDMEEMLRDADMALYSAKAEGRNRVVVIGKHPAPQAPSALPKSSSFQIEMSAGARSLCPGE